VYVLVTDSAADVCDADDCTSLEVRIEAANSAALVTAGLGEWNGEDEIDLNLARLHALAGAAATTPDWEQSWTAMVAYAERKGWLAADGSTVRAHIASESA
jgi:hypothetical protein